MDSPHSQGATYQWVGDIKYPLLIPSSNGVLDIIMVGIIIVCVIIPCQNSDYDIIFWVLLSVREGIVFRYGLFITVLGEDRSMLIGPFHNDDQFNIALLK